MHSCHLFLVMCHFRRQHQDKPISNSTPLSWFALHSASVAKLIWEIVHKWKIKYHCHHFQWLHLTIRCSAYLIFWCHGVSSSPQWCCHLVHGPLTRYAKLRIAHPPGMLGTFSLQPGVSDPDMHHGTCVTHVPRCMAGSLTSGYLWSRWRGKRSRHSRCMQNSQCCVSDKRPIVKDNAWWIVTFFSWLSVRCTLNLCVLCSSVFA